MNDAILGGLIALGGVIIGGLITLFTESLRRKWSVSDRQYQRRKEIADKRCDEAETYARAATEDFRHLMDTAKSLLLDESNLAEQIEQERKSWVYHLDKKVFSLGAAILALSDDELTESWGLIINSITKLNDLYFQIHKFRFNNGEKLDIEKTMIAIQDTWSKHSTGLGKFYKRIDVIRYQLSEK